MLKHEGYYRNLPESEKQFCEEEADEFSGQLSVPEKELLENLFPFEKE